MPVACPPAIPIGVVLPATGDIEIIFARRGTGRAVVQTLRRSFLIAQFVNVRTDPKSRHPLVAVLDLMPITGNPTLPRRKIAVHTADPQKIFPFFVPSPIARNPDDILAVWSILRWFFIDGRRWLLRYNEPLGRIDLRRLRECFMEWTRGERLHASMIFSRHRRSRARVRTRSGWRAVRILGWERTPA
jgi:hypothetical protein